MLIAVLMMTGCGMMKNSAPSSQTAQTSPVSTVETANTAISAGQGAGSALQAIYAQYKADGNKYDYRNMQNILNTVTLLANCEGLKDNYKNKDYLTDFGKGMIASSLGLVSRDNVQTVTNSLVDMVKNSETIQNTKAQATQAAQNTVSQAASYANTAAQYAGALSTLLGTFSGK
jgi:hypothetical protein